MKSLNSDVIVVGVGTFIIITFSTLLYFDFTRKLNVANAQEIGTISFKKRVAQRKYMGQVIWEDVEQTSTVYNNDTVRTENISEAVVRLKDGTDISLDENSMILLSIDENSININFTQGSIFAKRGNIQGEDVKEVTIQSKDAKVSIEKSDIQLTKTESKDLDLTVTGGTARIQIANKEQIVGKDQQIVIEKGSKEAKVRKLQLKPILPDPNKYYVTTANNVQVSFSWEKVEADQDVFLEISKDKNFAKKLVSKKVPANTAAEALEPGSYYWQLRAVDVKTGGVEISGSRKITVVRDKSMQLIAPENKKTFTFSSQAPIVNFRWSQNDIASGYSIDIAKDPAFKSVVKTVDTPLTNIAIGDLESGDYYWRVRSKIEFSSVSYSGSSDSLAFTVKKMREIAPPELISPQQNRVVGAELIKRKEFIFSWMTDNRFSNFRLLISRDKEFKDLVLNAVVNKNFHVMESELAAGRYFWKIQPVSEADEKVPFSQERDFTVISADKIPLVTPANKAEITLKEDQKEMPVSFSWSKSPVKGTYQFEIAGDRSFTALVDQKSTLNHALTIASLKAGKFYWRIRLLDNDKNQIIGSDIYEFDVAMPKIDVAAIAAEKARIAELEKQKENEREEQEKAAKTNLTVNSPMKQSVIYSNNKLVGRQTALLHPVPGEKVTITIKTQGYRDYQTDVTLNKGETKTINVQLVDMKLMARIRWKTNLLASILSKPIFEKENIVVATENGHIVNLNKYGGVVWRKNLSSISKSTPVIGDENVYVNTIDESLYALDLKTGSVKWKQQLEGPLLFGAEPLAVNGKVFVASSHGKVHAFSKEGKELWKRDLAAGIFSSMDHLGDLLFVGTDQSLVLALDDGDGDTDWSFEVDSRIISSSPKVDRDAVYIGCYSGSFYAIDAKRGRLKWKFNAEKSILANPAFHEDSVYIGSEDGNLYALDARDGKVLWKFRTGTKILSQPDLLNDELFITSGNAIYSLKMQSGNVSWVERFDGKINTSATVVDDNIVIGLDNGDLISLRSNLINVVK